ncbi:FAD-binding and (Fe-S)-binding domain-containing protein [Thermogemmatispora sp.]|uniref:FAD-binding and (Fe-S)-binding domain-containing protein n=1 Tax=Thermogemmatispora sp. TaxID=1968838 RepID=UPI0026131CAC|nr:FAD-binding and (Fe-S)-binding domain-containing protein [Thermogemmatispora sp.]
MTHIHQQPREEVISSRRLSELQSALRAQVRGDVRFDAGSRAMYSTDASNYRQVPLGVILPRDAEDVCAAIDVCRAYDVPILARGGGTSTAGQTCNVGVVLDLSRYMRHILSLDPERRLARVEPGVVLDDLRHAAEQHHLTFAPDPSTHNRCTLGGMIGNNSCGTHSLMGGKTVDNIEELEILTYDGLRLRVGPTSEEELATIIAAGGRRGEIYARLKTLRDRYADLIRQRYPNIPRRVSGYNLDQLLPEHGFHVARALVGSESTCVIVLEATVRLIPSPPARVLLVLGYPDFFRACDEVPELLEFRPMALEGLDEGLVADSRRKGLNLDHLRLLPPGGGWLLLEFGGQSHAEAEDQARALMAHLQHRRGSPPPQMRLCSSEDEARALWEVRESALGASTFVPGQPLKWEGWEDSAVHPSRLGAYLRELRALLDRYGYQANFYGHCGEGCVHMRASFDLESQEGIRQFRAFMEEAADLVVHYGGSLSGEHGDGQARAELLPKMFGPELLEAFREFKAIWDPAGRMNPGKVVNPYRLDADLRHALPLPRPTATHFQYPADHGNFAHAVMRCVGVGKCRRTDGGLMCPSYMVTREEAHSTRGRARLLFEMLYGHPLRGGWRSEEVRQALDLCLACKGCKSECPVNVDIATYKAEFLAHYYAGRLRPLSAYLFGLIHRWAALGARAPELINLLTQTPLLSHLLKRTSGIAPERRLPRLAPLSFRAWFRERSTQTRPTEQSCGMRVLLWPDTFNNYFHPETARAAVEVLEALGFQVELPPVALCCGRPLYDYGMLTTAKQHLRQILTALRPYLEQDIPIVGLEPGCVSVFRDELPNLFPEDREAQQLKERVLLLSEFLERYAGDYRWPRLEGQALLQPHCHQRALMDVAAERRLLSKLGLQVEIPDAGCCGMAGAFGFEAQHYAISLQVGERVLLPTVRAARPETLIIADGFSCREQIAQTTPRRALHLAEVLQLALRLPANARLGPYPERAALFAPPIPTARRRLSSAFALTGSLLLTVGTLLLLRRRHDHRRSLRPPLQQQRK